MGDILGIGTTHYPPGLVPEHLKPWPLARMLHTDPRIPERFTPWYRRDDMLITELEQFGRRKGANDIGVGVSD